MMSEAMPLPVGQQYLQRMLSLRSNADDDDERTDEAAALTDGVCKVWVRRIVHEFVSQSVPHEQIDLYLQFLSAKKPPLALLIASHRQADSDRKRRRHTYEGDYMETAQVDEWCRDQMHRRARNSSLAGLVSIARSFAAAGVVLSRRPDVLSSDIWMHVTRFLELRDILPLRFINRNWFDMLTNPKFWQSLKSVVVHLSLFAMQLPSFDQYHTFASGRFSLWMDLSNVREIVVIDDLKDFFPPFIPEKGDDPENALLTGAKFKREFDAFGALLQRTANLVSLCAPDFEGITSSVIHKINNCCPLLEVLRIGHHLPCSVRNGVSNEALTNLTLFSHLRSVEIGGNSTFFTSAGLVAFFINVCNKGVLNFMKLYQVPGSLLSPVCLYIVSLLNKDAAELARDPVRNLRFGMTHGAMNDRGNCIPIEGIRVSTTFM
jgi:hypothetical protein